MNTRAKRVAQKVGTRIRKHGVFQKEMKMTGGGAGQKGSQECRGTAEFFRIHHGPLCGQNEKNRSLENDQKDLRKP